MQTPVQIHFHGLPSSRAVERDVQGRLADLEKVFPGIVSCRVSIDLPHLHRERGRYFEVKVDVGLPGSHVIAGRTAGGDPAHEDVHVAIRDAFRSARRQLESQAHRMRMDAPPVNEQH